MPPGHCDAAGDLADSTATSRGSEDAMAPNRVFVSYSHHDKKWRDQLNTLLAPAVDSDELEFWHDGLIPPGADWHETLERALVGASTGVVLVTPNLLASKFVTQ